MSLKVEGREIWMLEYHMNAGLWLATQNLSKDRDIVYKQEWHGTDWQYADNQQGVITCQYAYLMQ